MAFGSGSLALPKSIFTVGFDGVHSAVGNRTPEASILMRSLDGIQIHVLAVFTGKALRIRNLSSRDG